MEKLKEQEAKGVEVGDELISPENEEEDVLDLTDIKLESGPKECFADELEELEVRFAGAAVGLPKLTRGEDGKMMELVSHGFIRRLMTTPRPSRPFPDCSVEALRRTGITDEESLETLARGFRAMQIARDIENDIIRQYRDKGYAYVDLGDDDHLEI